MYILNTNIPPNYYIYLLEERRRKSIGAGLGVVRGQEVAVHKLGKFLSSIAEIPQITSKIEKLRKNNVSMLLEMLRQIASTLKGSRYPLKPIC